MRGAGADSDAIGCGPPSDGDDTRDLPRSIVDCGPSVPTGWSVIASDVIGVITTV